MATIPFSLLGYLIGECHYGGRVTDVWDRRALQAVLDMFVSARAALEGFDVEEPSLQGLHDLSSLEAMVACAHSLPGGAPPLAFGLHSNADIAKRTLVTRGLLDELLTCEPQQPMTMALAQDGQASDLSVTEVLVDDVRYHEG
jgi:dynein heavy chain